MTRSLLTAAALGLFTLGTASVASAQFPQPFPRFPQPLPQYPQYPQPGPQFPRPVPVPGGGHDHHDRHYHVKYRTCDHEPWRVYGTYESHRYAHMIADRLERRGYDARVVHH